MDAVRLGEGRWELDKLVERVEAGETIDIMREGQVVAKMVPADAAQEEPHVPHPSWKKAGIDWDEIRRFAATLPYDPTNSVVEMRKQARY